MSLLWNLIQYMAKEGYCSLRQIFTSHLLRDFGQALRHILLTREVDRMAIVSLVSICSVVGSLDIHDKFV